MDKEIIINKLKKDGIVVTHFGDDLDNTASVESLRRESGIDLIVERVPAGQFIKGRVNIDTGGHRGSWADADTIVIDSDTKTGIKSASMQLYFLGFNLPLKIVEIADIMTTSKYSLDPAYGRNLVKYLDPKNLFEFAEDGLIDRILTENELIKHGLHDGYLKQKTILKSALEKIEHYGYEDTVIAEEFIPMGSQVAYQMGYLRYASISPHSNNSGITFAITSAPGTSLPDSALEWARDLSKQYSRNDDYSSNIYVSDDMIIAGGNKNRDFSLPWNMDETVELIKDLLTGKVSRTVVVS